MKVIIHATDRQTFEVDLAEEDIELLKAKLAAPQRWPLVEAPAWRASAQAAPRDVAIVTAHIVGFTVVRSRKVVAQ